jgi:N-carbamoylputrescine amidase
MRIALIPELFYDLDLEHNKAQMLKWLQHYRDCGVDLLVFGEAFLQGFGALNADYEHDLAMALSQDDACFDQLKQACKETNIALAFGYIENAQGSLYSACMVIDADGQLMHNFRRVSPGWKLGSAFQDKRYQEGDDYTPFELASKRINIAICGDLWYEDLIENYKTVESDLLLWPLYTNYDIETWEGGEKEEYAKRVAMLDRPVLMVNCIDEGEYKALGGAFVFENGQVSQELAMGEKGVLIVEL